MDIRNCSRSCKMYRLNESDILIMFAHFALSVSRIFYIQIYATNRAFCSVCLFCIASFSFTELNCGKVHLNKHSIYMRRAGNEAVIFELFDIFSALACKTLYVPLLDD